MGVLGLDGCWGDGECTHCHGSGWYREKAAIGCSYCNKSGGINYPGDGRCGLCGGSGRCKHCGGSGYK
jgi:hypothetical protein